MKNAPTLATLADDLAAGRTSARKLVDACLAKIADTSGEGARAFIHVDAEAAIEAAEAMDRLREIKAAPSRFAGIPVSIKDLFDIRGQVTRAGSRALEDSAPADADAPAVARLRRAGFVVIGRTNMTEFAYSGIGINPHFGTPKGAWQRSVGHVPGGSSSGAAVSVADGMAYGALGTDTGGSCRIPAAYNGIVGFKPTQRRVPLDGAVPLSFTLDSIGPLARTVACCAALDAVLADETFVPLQPRPVKGMRLAVPTTVALDDLDDAVATTFERALETLSRQGALIERIEVPEFLDVAPMNAKGGFSAAESYAWHRFLIASKGNIYDPRVASRILRGESISAADYVDFLGARKSLIARATLRLAPYDALIMPTTANTPPRIADLAEDKDFTRANLASLRNCSLINMIDGCSISLPCHREGEVPVGLMLAASGGADRRSLNWRQEWRTQSVFDLTFTVQDNGAGTPLTLPIDQAVIAGWTGRDPVARDKHIAELDALGIAPPASTPIYYRVLRAANNHHGQHRSLRTGFQRRGRVRADRLAGPHLRRPRLRSHRPQGGSLQRHRVEADVRQGDGAGLVGAGRCRRPLGPHDPACLGMDRRRARAVPGRHAGSHAPGQGIDRARFRRQGISRRLRHVRRHLCRHRRHPPGRSFRV